MEGVVGIFAGFGLAAACGLRVFLPLLIMSVAANSGYLELTPGYEWIASEVAVTTLALATVIEIGAYYVPWLDNLLDTVALPASFIAGTLAMSPAVAEWHPFLAWTIAIVAGGGVATAVQGGTMLVRGGSSLSTGGLANPIVSTVEAGAGGILSVMAILVPILAVVVAVVALGFALNFILKFLRVSMAK
jgi:hypothetical protein